MKRHLLLLSLGFVLSAFASHAAEPKPQVLKLTDGRTLADWKIMSETSSAVYVKYKGGAVKVDKKLLPPELLALHPINPEGAKVEAAALAESARAGEVRKAQVEVQRAKDYEERIAKIAADRKNGVIPPQGVTPVDTSQTISAADKTQVEGALRDRADRFFRYEYQAGSGYLYVIRTSVDVNEIAVRPGWPGEYSVSGTGFIQFYDSSPHGYFKRESREFSATVKIKDGTARVVDFRQR